MCIILKARAPADYLRYPRADRQLRLKTSLVGEGRMFIFKRDTPFENIYLVRAHRKSETEKYENSNSKTLILKDSSVRSIWTCLTASPCYTTTTLISTTIPQTDIISIGEEERDRRNRDKLRERKERQIDREAD